MGTSDGFYTKLSKRPRETDLVSFYLIFMGFACISVLALTIISCATPVAGFIWPGQQSRYIIMGAILGCLSWAIFVLNKSTDAYGLTVPSEVSRIIQKGLGIILLLPIVWLNRLNLTSYFGYWYVLMLFLGASFVWINARHGHPFPKNFLLPLSRFKNYASEFYRFSSPLATYSAVAFATGIIGRWLLQIFSGSVQQAFFGLSFQISTLCVVCVASMAPLLMREFSIAHQNLDLSEMASLFRKHIPLLYSVTAYFSCFVAFQSDVIVRLIGGRGYAGASTAVMLMSLSSIHQTYGQLSGSVFFASGRTHHYRNVGIATMLAGLVMNYFLLAPARAGGLHLGATGLALQTLATQFASVNIQLYLNSKFLRLPFLRYLGHQMGSLAIFLAVAYVARVLANTMLDPQVFWVACFLLAGIFYTAAVGILAWKLPRLFGLKSEQFAAMFDKFLRR